MTRRTWIGLAAVALLAGVAVLLVWQLGDGAEVRRAAALPLAAEAPPPAPPPAEPPLPVEAPPGGEETVPQRVGGLASDRDPRNDIQRPTDERADLLQAERAARTDAAMDQLNRRSQRRRAAMQNIGEVKPAPPPPPPGPPAR
jgi:hypothetical protein